MVPKDASGGYVAKARGKILGGQKATWQLSWDGSGQFTEAVNTDSLSWRTGATGTSLECWHEDMMRQHMHLELEDMESELITHWVMTGQWAHPPAINLLDVELLPHTDQKQRQQKGRVAAVLKLRLAGCGKMAARLALDSRSAEPQWLELFTAAGIERWEFQKWKVWPCGMLLPSRMKQRPAAGGDNTFKMVSVEEAPFQAKESPVQPSDAPVALFPHVQYDTEAVSQVVAVRGEGGHILIQGEVDGKEAGLFVLDTGSSGLVLEPQLAEELGLAVVGEQFSTGIGDSIQASLRRAETLTVGPVSILRPIFSTMALSGALRGPTDRSRVVGVVGYDLLSVCTVRVESRRREPGSTTSGRLEVHIYPPGMYMPPPQVSLAWQPLVFISKVPLVRAGVCIEEVVEDAAPRLQASTSSGAAGGSEKGQGEELLASRDTALFKLCLGVGGTGCILGKEAAERVHVFYRLLGLQPGGTLTGPGSQQARLQGVGDVVTVRLTWVELQGMRFEAVRALVHTQGDPADLELGQYAAGQLAGDLFRGDCTLVIDYPGRRIAAVPPQD